MPDVDYIRVIIGDRFNFEGEWVEKVERIQGNIWIVHLKDGRTITTTELITIITKVKGERGEKIDGWGGSGLTEPDPSPR